MSVALNLAQLSKKCSQFRRLFEKTVFYSLIQKVYALKICDYGCTEGLCIAQNERQCN